MLSALRTAAPRKLTRSNQVELVRKLYAAIQGADSAKLHEVLSPDWVEDPLAYLGQPKGPDDYLPVAQNLQNAFADFKVEILEILDATPKYVVRTKMSGRHQADFFGIPSTDKNISFNTIDIHEVADGKILRSWHIEDFAGAMKQMKGA
jgi:steroid delta-isomerase-like uncharacterized protein